MKLSDWLKARKERRAERKRERMARRLAAETGKDKAEQAAEDIDRELVELDELDTAEPVRSEAAEPQTRMTEEYIEFLKKQQEEAAAAANRDYMENVDELK